MKVKLLSFTSILFALFINCKKENEIAVNGSGATPNTKPVATVYGSRTVSFNQVDGAYSSVAAITDFGNIDTPFNEFGNGTISENALKIRIPKNTMSATDPTPFGDGLRYNVDIEDGEEYELSFKVKFDVNFKWSRGGKIGPGLVIGKGLSGCKPVINDGASARFMWYGTGDNTKETNIVYFQPYLYFADQTSNCGTTFSKKSVNLQKNKWYTLYMRVKSNTGDNSDGAIVMKVDGVELYSNTSFRWTKTTSSDRLVKKMSFNVFRGGSSENWISPTDDDVYFDDIKWTKL
jgi:hypothetical protein